VLLGRLSIGREELMGIDQAVEGQQIDDPGIERRLEGADQ
jgi:hypothetical protein